MKDTSKEVINNLLKTQKQFFGNNQTKDLNFRIQQLKILKSAIEKFEKEICDALYVDLRKSYEEAFLTEISIVYREINDHIRFIKKWVKPKRVATPLPLLPSKSKIVYEPLGVALIYAPWNYPFQLLFDPLVGAISSGCCATIKPSPYTPTVAKVIEKLIEETFDEKYISVVQGGRDVNQYLASQQFDLIFYTGSSYVGKVIMRAAAENLTPVVLELGGKSPCIVDKNSNIDIAAKRIAWGKTVNSGQTCIAPDYLFVHKSVKAELLKKIELNFKSLYGDDIQKSKYYPRIVNEKALKRLKSLMKNGKIHSGGEVDTTDKFIAPTIIDDIKIDDQIMQEEIFGPLLPVLTFEDIDDPIKFINDNEKPLAFYYFGKNKDAKEVLSKTSSGGGCINDTIMHFANHQLPFGGVGNSGFGKYHGIHSFLSFSNQRSIVTTPTWIDIPLKYAPFKYFNLIKKIL